MSILLVERSGYILRQFSPTSFVVAQGTEGKDRFDFIAELDNLEDAENFLDELADKRERRKNYDTSISI